MAISLQEREKIKRETKYVLPFVNLKSQKYRKRNEEINYRN